MQCVYWDLRVAAVADKVSTLCWELTAGRPTTEHVIKLLDIVSEIIEKSTDVEYIKSMTALLLMVYVACAVEPTICDLGTSLFLSSIGTNEMVTNIKVLNHDF